MKPFLPRVLLTLGVACAVQARPVIIENLASFGTPDPAYERFGESVAIDGDYALATGSRSGTDPDDPAVSRTFHTAFLLRRNGTAWNLVRRLDEYLENRDFQIPPAVAMRGGVAAVQTVRTDFYRQSEGGWSRVDATDVTDGPGPYLVINNGRVLSGEGTCVPNVHIFAPDQTGNWRTLAVLLGEPRTSGCDNDKRGGSMDSSGPWAISWQAEPEGRSPHALIYRDYGGTTGWYNFAYGSADRPAGATDFGPEVAISDLDAYVSGGNENGTYVFREDPAFGFKPVGVLQPVDGYMGAGHATGLARSDEFLLARAFSFDRSANVIHVFRRATSLPYEHVATLVGRNGETLGARVAISGRRVLVGGGDGIVHYFELPATLSAPTPRQETFATGINNWSTSAGSAFTPLSSGSSRLYRQAATDLGTRAVYAPADWTNQAIETDVRPRTFGAPDAGFGLATRYQGTHNFFDVVVRSNGLVELRRMASNRLRTLARANVTITAGRNYRLRLESIGTQHRVYLDRRLILEADSTGPTHGRVVLTTDRTAADFDNVLVTPSPFTTLFATDFEGESPGPWQISGFGLWSQWSGASKVYFQSSVAGDARAAIGAPADDQVVRVRARLDTFATAIGAQERWFGVMARQSDARNYYYLTLRSSNQLSLRKFVDGAATVLASTAFTVAPGTWYDLRLEVVGSELRAYVNGTLRLEATDTTHTHGRSGPVMFKTAADYDDFIAYQP
jgi:hypothetical protein